MLIPDLLVRKMTSISKAVFPHASLVLSIWSCFRVGETSLGDKILQEKGAGFQSRRAKYFWLPEKGSLWDVGLYKQKLHSGTSCCTEQGHGHCLNEELSRLGSPWSMDFPDASLLQNSDKPCPVMLGVQFFTLVLTNIFFQVLPWACLFEGKPVAAPIDAYWCCLLIKGDGEQFQETILRIPGAINDVLSRLWNQTAQEKIVSLLSLQDIVGRGAGHSVALNYDSSIADRNHDLEDSNCSQIPPLLPHVADIAFVWHPRSPADNPPVASFLYTSYCIIFLIRRAFHMPARSSALRILKKTLCSDRFGHFYRCLSIQTQKR